MMNLRENELIEIVSLVCPSTNLSALGLAILNENNQIAHKLLHAAAKIYYTSPNEAKDLSPIFLVCEMENIAILEQMCDHKLAIQDPEVLNS